MQKRLELLTSSFSGALVSFFGGKIDRGLGLQFLVESFCESGVVVGKIMLGTYGILFWQ